MIDIWNAQEPAQYTLHGAPAAMQQPSIQINAGEEFHHQIYHPKDAEDYNAIPPGAYFVDPQDGQLYQKTPEKRGIEV